VRGRGGLLEDGSEQEQNYGIERRLGVYETEAQRALYATAQHAYLTPFVSRILYAFLVVLIQMLKRLHKVFLSANLRSIATHPATRGVKPGIIQTLIISPQTTGLNVMISLSHPCRPTPYNNETV